MCKEVDVPWMYSLEVVEHIECVFLAEESTAVRTSAPLCLQTSIMLSMRSYTAEVSTPQRSNDHYSRSYLQRVAVLCNKLGPPDTLYISQFSKLRDERTIFTCNDSESASE
jgi:hypothetical protein